MKFPTSSALVFLAVASLALSSCKGPGEAPESCFPPEGVDHLSMTVTADIEIFAIGKDRVDLKGTVAVHRSGPTGSDGKEMVGDLIGASLRGKSKVFGDVIAVQSPIQHSPCKYTCEGPGQYKGFFDINGWFWMPQHGLAVFSTGPVHVEGPATVIPPVGQKAAMPAGDVALHDFGNPGGEPVGAVRRAEGLVHDVVNIQQHLERPDTTIPALVK